ncbi:NUT family member 2G-like [Phacochoerus africanus]|uniref:NUT family member 2G-like n=1 Tax=Phacochoerus africanus TaxID=41426 RepID=UPI001FDAB3FB|nr:NUT family member 2G-like [Phacochoerus africanus]
MASSPLLGTDVTIHPGASGAYPPLTPGSQPQPAWEQHLPPPMAPLRLPGSTLLQPARPMTPRVTPADHGPIAPGLGNITVPAWSGGRSASPHQSQAFGRPQAPLNGNASRALMGSALCPAPLCTASAAGDSGVAAPPIAAAQAGKGGLAPGLPPQAAPPAAQVAFNLPPGSSGPWPHGTSGAGSLHASQHRGPQEDASHQNSVYQNFRRWQRFKSLARSHLPQSPDAEALSCFLIPVLRTLARLKPTMTLEEGMRQAMQEWQHMSTVERMAFYEMAAKFMQFEAEDEIRMGNLSCTTRAQGMPPPAPPKLAPQEPTSRKRGTQSWQLLENKAPEEIPPEARREHGDIPEALVGPGPSATGESHMEGPEDGYELPQDEDGCFPDPDLLSYVDKLCSQEDLDTKVEAVIHPRFLAELLSPEPELDLSGLAEELEQEEGLSPEEVAGGGSDTQGGWGRGGTQVTQDIQEARTQLVQKRVLASEEDDGVPATPNHRAPHLDSRPSESTGPTRCPEERARPTARGHQQPPQAGTAQPFPRQGTKRSGPPSGPRASKVLREASPLSGAPGLGHGFSEDEEELPSLAFLLGLHHSLLPWGLPQSPVPASGLVCTAGQRAQQAPQAPFPQRMGLSSGPLQAAKSRKRAWCGGLAAAEDLARPRADLRGSGRHTLALGLVDPSQPNRSTCDPGVTGRRRKRHCSQ